MSRRSRLTLVALGLALVAIGLPGHFLSPRTGTTSQADRSRRLRPAHGAQWPYAGRGRGHPAGGRLAIPPALVLAAAFSFWPVRPPAGARRGRPRDPRRALRRGDHRTELRLPLGRGLLLLILIAAWLWLPRLTSRTGLFAAGLAVARRGIGHCSGCRDPTPTTLDRLLQLGPGRQAVAAERFDWNHRYGPDQLARTAAPLLMVKSAEPHYWKAETLDYFDGLRWSHTGPGRQRADRRRAAGGPKTRIDREDSRSACASCAATW